MNLKWSKGDRQLSIITESGERIIIRPSSESGGTLKDSITFKFELDGTEYRVQFQTSK